MQEVINHDDMLSPSK